MDAAADLPNISLISIIVQGGSFALLAYSIIYGLPWLYRSIREDRKEMFTFFAEQIRLREDRMSDRFDRFVKTVTAKDELNDKRIAKVLEHNENNWDRIAQAICNSCRTQTGILIEELRLLHGARGPRPGPDEPET